MYAGQLRIDSDPERNDAHQPGTFATPGNYTGTSKWYTGNYPLYQRHQHVCKQTSREIEDARVGTNLQCGQEVKDPIQCDQVPCLVSV